MARRKSKTVTILGYRLKREFFVKAVILAFCLLLLIVASVVVLMLVSENRQEKVRAKIQNESIEQKELVEQAQVVREIQKPEKKLSDVKLLMTRQRDMSGFPLEGVLKLNGKMKQKDGDAPFVLWWSPQAIRVEIGNGDAKKTTIVQEKGAWEITGSKMTSMDRKDYSDEILLWPVIFDPFRFSGKLGYDYTELFDESYQDRNCHVVGLRVKGERESRIFLDAKTNIEVRRLVWLVGREHGQHSLGFENYYEVNGSFLPKIINLEGNGQEIRFEVAEYELLKDSKDVFLPPGS